MRLSRTAATRSLILLGAAVYLILIALTGAVARAVGSDYAELAQAISLAVALGAGGLMLRSEEHTSELQSLMRISYAVFCLKKKKNTKIPRYTTSTTQAT